MTETPRYCPSRKFPPYRFLPGATPHPRRDPAGHSFGQKEERPSYRPPDRWHENELYLFGIDLYHQGYLWESHEAWEALWHLTGKEDGEGQFLQGLIQNAAAQLKLTLRQWDGATHLSEEAHRRLQRSIELGVCDGKGNFMGLNLPELIQDLERHYGPLWKGKRVVSNPPPHLNVLSFQIAKITG